MNHDMTLYDDPFNAIQSNEKLVEIRLWDQKRVCVKLFSVTFNPKENFMLYGKLFNSG